LRRIVFNMGTNAVRRDTTAETVSANVKRLRTEQNLGLRGLAKELGEAGRPLGHSAVDQIEKGTRRVDVDDLVALAAALGVSPITLLLPGRPDPGNPAEFVAVADDPAKPLAVAGVDISAGRLWLWLKSDEPLPGYARPRRRFYVDSRPEWDPGPGDPRLWTEGTPEGDPRMWTEDAPDGDH
jgi:transcriptional regulator with XRE-family HTH domain